jgi:hypothetical protein
MMETVHRLTILHRWLVILAGFAAALGHSPSAAEQRTPSEIEILSKADALRLFGLTKEQWLRNVRDAVATGGATQTYRQPSPMVGMATTTPEGDLLTVNLDYSKSDSRPVFIQVIVGYRPDRAARFTDQSVRDAIAAAQRQMAPEFEVHGNSERIEGGLGIFFAILDRREAVVFQDLTCGDYSGFAENQKVSLAYGYLEGVQAALDKDVADILVPPADAKHAMWWVLPAGLGEEPAKGLAEKLDSHCRSPVNRREGLLAAFLSMSYQKDGWPALGILTNEQKTDPWKSILGGKGSSVSCSAYTASREETRQAIIYGYYLGTEALKVRLKSSVDVEIVWPSKMSVQAVRVEVDQRCQKEKEATLRDVLWLTTAELGVKTR